MKGIIGIICPILQVFKMVLFNTVHTIYGLLKARIPAELFHILKDDAVKVLHSICQQIWKTQQWPHHSSPKERQCQRMLKLLHSCTHPHACKVMLKILPDGFRKGRGTRDQIANICWIIKKAREFQKNIYFLFIDYTKAFDCVDHNKLWKILQ